MSNNVARIQEIIRLIDQYHAGKNDLSRKQAHKLKIELNKRKKQEWNSGRSIPKYPE